LKRVVFYCSWHHGDWHLAKSFIENFFLQFDKSGIECVAVTSRDPHIVNIDRLKSEHITNWPRLMSNPPSFWDEGESTFYINIWVGHHRLIGGDGGNHNFVNQIPMWKSIADHIERETGFHLECIVNPELTVPNITSKMLGKYDKAPPNSVFFANSTPWSGQTLINSMPGAILSLAEEFQNVNFICTQSIGIEKENIFYTNDMTNFENCGYNPLPEVAKISEGCKIIVTNCSGPGTFAMTRYNFNCGNKTMIVLLANIELSPHTGVSHRNKIIFSSTYDEWEVGRIVREEIINKGMNKTND